LREQLSKDSYAGWEQTISSRNYQQPSLIKTYFQQSLLKNSVPVDLNVQEIEG